MEQPLLMPPAPCCWTVVAMILLVLLLALLTALVCLWQDVRADGHGRGAPPRSHPVPPSPFRFS